MPYIAQLPDGVRPRLIPPIYPLVPIKRPFDRARVARAVRRIIVQQVKTNMVLIRQKVPRSKFTEMADSDKRGQVAMDNVIAAIAMASPLLLRVNSAGTLSPPQIDYRKGGLALSKSLQSTTKGSATWAKKVYYFVNGNKQVIRGNAKTSKWVYQSAGGSSGGKKGKGKGKRQDSDDPESGSAMTYKLRAIGAESGYFGALGFDADKLGDMVRSDPKNPPFAMGDTLHQPARNPFGLSKGAIRQIRNVVMEETLLSQGFVFTRNSRIDTARGRSRTMQKAGMTKFDFGEQVSADSWKKATSAGSGDYTIRYDKFGEPIYE